MDNHDLMSFEDGMDQFMSNLKKSLQQDQLHVTHQTMPQCLESYKVADDRANAYFLRLVVIGYTPTTMLARLSWLDAKGRDHICCYLNSAFEAVKRKKNGLWVREKNIPEAMCLQTWSRLQSPFDCH